MAITKAQKKEINKKLGSALTDSATSVFVTFSGLGVEDNNTLRKTLKQNDSDYMVAKKTLVKRAMDAAGLSGDQPDLGDGMVAVAFGNDPMAPAREVFEFSKTHKENISIILDLKLIFITIWVVLFPKSNILSSLIKGMPKNKII